jgi:hypothetical protein
MDPNFREILRLGVEAKAYINRKRTLCKSIQKSNVNPILNMKTIFRAKYTDLNSGHSMKARRCIKSFEQSYLAKIYIGLTILQLCK